MTCGGKIQEYLPFTLVSGLAHKEDSGGLTQSIGQGISKETGVLLLLTCGVIYIVRFVAESEGHATRPGEPVFGRVGIEPLYRIFKRDQVRSPVLLCSLRQVKVYQAPGDFALERLCGTSYHQQALSLFRGFGFSEDLFIN